MRKGIKGGGMSSSTVGARYSTIQSLHHVSLDATEALQIIEPLQSRYIHSIVRSARQINYALKELPSNIHGPPTKCAGGAAYSGIIANNKAGIEGKDQYCKIASASI